MTDRQPAPDLRAEESPEEDWLDFHIVRVEVTVTAVIEEPGGTILGKNMVDATLGFGWRTSEPPPGMTDAQVNAALTSAISPVMAFIQTGMTFNGWVFIGQVDEPMSKASATVVGEGRTEPVEAELYGEAVNPPDDTVPTISVRVGSRPLDQSYGDLQAQLRENHHPLENESDLRAARQAEDSIVGMFATNEGDEAMLREAFAAVRRLAKPVENDSETGDLPE